MNMPTLAIVDGHMMAGGVMLALAHDHCYARDDPKIKIQLNEINFGNKKIIYSGDTTYSKNVINNSKNADILIHEVISVSKKIYDNNKKLRKVVNSHTNVSQLIQILNICKPKLTILNHALLFGVNEQSVLTSIAKEYNGKVIFAKDFMSVDLGEEINIFNTGK